MRLALIRPKAPPIRYRNRLAAPERQKFAAGASIAHVRGALRGPPVGAGNDRQISGDAWAALDLPV
jgi:hypothetical protein